MAERLGYHEIVDKLPLHSHIRLADNMLVHTLPDGSGDVFHIVEALESFEAPAWVIRYVLLSCSLKGETPDSYGLALYTPPITY